MSTSQTDRTAQEDGPFVFSKPEHRQRFIDKTLLTVSAQLGVTAAVIILARSIPILSALINSLSFLWAASFFGTVLALSCVRSLCQSYPTNYYILGALTVSQAFVVHSSTVFVSSEIMSEAVVITAVLLGLCYIFAQMTDFDFTSPKFLMMFNLSHIGLLFIGWLIFPSSSFFWAYLSGLATLVYIVADIHMIMGNKKLSLTVDDHIFASMMLYIDIISLVMKIISILDDQKEKKDKKSKN